MARPSKVGLDYFPLDTNIDQDDKVIIIIAKYGMEGFGILVKLLMEIYKNGYFYPWTEKEQLIFSSRVSVDINSVMEIVNDCIKWGLFHKKVYEQHHILTSKGIQERYLLAASRRVENGINEDINLVSVNINSVSDDITLAGSTQKKRKETKLKETKLKDTKDNTLLEIENLRQRYSEVQLKLIDDYFDMLRHTRKSAKLAPSISLKIYKYWDKYPSVCVEYGVKTHTDNPQYHSKTEAYTQGIIRKTTAEEAVKKLAQPKEKKSFFAQGEESKQRQRQDYKPLVEDTDISDEDLPY
jgi:hypothetical protein